MVELSRSRTEVIAVCRPNSKVDQFLATHQIRRVYLPKDRKLSFTNIHFVKRLIEESNVSVLHVHFHRDIWVASAAVRSDRRRKLFLSVYMGVDSKNDPFHRWVYGRVDALFSSSEELNSRLHLLYPVPKEKIHFLPYGRRLETYRRDLPRRQTLRRRLNVSEDEVLVGTMVRIDPGKCVMDFARSFLYLGNDVQDKTRYVIIGEPTRKGHASPDESPFEPHCVAYLNDLKTFIAEHKLDEKIILLGYQEDLPEYLNAMDLFVFPSRDELYSLVVLDAMCTALPVVAARAGGNLRQVIDGVNGMLFTVGDSGEIAQEISAYVRDPSMRKVHGAAGRQFVEQHHGMERTLGMLLAFYEGTERMKEQ
jgi:glycosyltransferase involved in cell wall biosynthesis